MECFKVENLSFTYPKRDKKTLDGINITINQGEFVTLIGKSGSGKTTLLRLLKPSLAPFGDINGCISFLGKDVNTLSKGEDAAKIGFVMQKPDNQIVCDKVWHELAFLGESLGLKQGEIRMRVAEMASFFGIENWFYNKVSDLSGGQKQLLNLASVMVMQPEVLILDEPSSQLDPISAREFLKAVERINRELGTTVILTEHRLSEAFPISDRVIVIDDGKIIADEKPKKVAQILKNENHSMYYALPIPALVANSVCDGEETPLTIREGRVWLENYKKNNIINPELIKKRENKEFKDGYAVEIKDVFFRYEKDSPDIVKGLNLKVRKGEFYAVLGGNGTGKTTTLSLISGQNTPYRGKIIINGSTLGMLPQNPESLFLKSTVYDDLSDVLKGQKLSKEDEEKRIYDALNICRLFSLSGSHPYDLSGGEQQRLALAKVLLLSPEIILLDEPTKGMDEEFKEEFYDIISGLLKAGHTVIMVSHDIEFCAKYADRCALFFDGNITSEDIPDKFFKGKNFYTTAACRMAGTVLPDAVIPDDIILALGGKIKKREKKDITLPPVYKKESAEKKEKISPLRIIFGVIFALLFILIVCYDKGPNPSTILTVGLQLASIVTLAISLYFLLPKGEEKTKEEEISIKITKGTLLAFLFIIIAVPLTIFMGIHLFEDRKYYFISLLIIFETLIPFFAVFEKRKPKARELILISTICAIAVAGRTVFLPFPQFKPVIALVIITGMCFGGEMGFLVGAVTGFVSNFFFGQGPWTPWQMFGFGIIGYVSGILFGLKIIKREKIPVCILGFLLTFLYGLITNPSTVIQFQSNINFKMLLASYITGFPFDVVHGVSTSFFLWFLIEPMKEKLSRIKIKYGLI